MGSNLVLQAELDELRERNRQLEEALTGLADAALAMKLGLTPAEHTIFRVFRAHGVVSRDALMLALYSDRPEDPPEPKTVDVFICKLRKKIAGQGFAITNQWGTGWRLERKPEGGAQ